jgi:hypothetical protein
MKMAVNSSMMLVKSLTSRSGSEKWSVIHAIISQFYINFL